MWLVFIFRVEQRTPARSLLFVDIVLVVLQTVVSPFLYSSLSFMWLVFPLEKWSGISSQTGTVG